MEGQCILGFQMFFTIFFIEMNDININLNMLSSSSETKIHRCENEELYGGKSSEFCTIYHEF